MRKLTALAAALLIGAAPLPVLAGGSPGVKVPARVKAFIERREGCEHFAGEDPYDAERARFIAAAVARLRCDRLERDAASLRRMYRGNRAVLAMLETRQWR